MRSISIGLLQLQILSLTSLFSPFSGGVFLVVCRRIHSFLVLATTSRQRHRLRLRRPARVRSLLPHRHRKLRPPRQAMVALLRPRATPLPPPAQRRRGGGVRAADMIGPRSRQPPATPLPIGLTVPPRSRRKRSGALPRVAVRVSAAPELVPVLVVPIAVLLAASLRIDPALALAVPCHRGQRRRHQPMTRPQACLQPLQRHPFIRRDRHVRVRAVTAVMEGRGTIYHTAGRRSFQRPAKSTSITV